ncbi:MAG: hypothetical protein B6240_12095 [Desulfobacteraceae bacterium 4572_87]|nr:MAG: hypothetical protein B6240_12095 [Desulfobacteraceae bacterium 4572_87]
MLNLPNLPNLNTNGYPGNLMGLKRRLPFMVLCLFVWAWAGSSVWGGDITGPYMTATLVPNQTSVGGIITLTLRFQLPEGAHLATETEVSGLEGFQVLGRNIVFDGAKNKDGKQENSDTSTQGECRIKLMVGRLDSGEVGPVSLSYVSAKGKTALLEAAPVSLTVLSNLGEKPEEARLRPIYGIMPTESYWMKYRFWILGGIALLLLAVVCEWWIRRRRGKGIPVIDETPPDKLAIRALKDLDALKLFENGQIKDFYFGFSEILRRYLEAIRGFPAAEYTLEEIARAVKKKEDQSLLALLRRVDMVKFADSTATPAGKKDHMETAFVYIRNTREPVMTETAAARRGGKHIMAHGPRAGRRSPS